jgi:hypothetical protein
MRLSLRQRRLILYDRKFSLLFFALLTFLVLDPYVEHSGAHYLGFRIIGAVVTLLSIYAVAFERWPALVALILAVPTLAQRILLPRADQGAIALFITASSFAFDLTIIVIISRRVFGTKQPDSDTVFGALCVYLLVGYGFANGYYMLATIQPDAFSFDPMANRHPIPGRLNFIYYSFGTLTSMGAPGITPASQEARSLTAIEAITGVLYVAVLIARLIDLYKASSRDSVARQREED